MNTARNRLLSDVDEPTRARIRQVLAKAGLSEDDPAAVVGVLLGYVQHVGGTIPDAIDKAGERLVRRVEKATVSLAWSRKQLALILTTVLATGGLGGGAGWLWRDWALAKTEPLAHWLLTTDSGQQWLELARHNDLAEALAYCRKTARRQNGRPVCLLPIWTAAASP